MTVPYNLQRKTKHGDVSVFNKLDELPVVFMYYVP